MRTMTPVHIEDPYGLIGTYDFTDFTSDSIANIWITKIEVYVGTKNESKYQNSVQRIIGEMTFNYDGATVNMTTKIQMESSKMEEQGGIGDIDPKAEQFALTTYNPMSYAGNGSQFGTTGSQQDGIVTQDGELLLVSQSFKKSIADVTVKSYLRKKSDVPAVLDKLRYFDYLDAGKTQKSNAFEHDLGGGSPAVEPDYTIGQITYN